MNNESHQNGLSENGKAARKGKYLTLSLAFEEYGIGICKVKEIIRMIPITSVPQTLNFVKGVINLRGRVIPVIDLRMRFEMPPMDYTERTCIIITEVWTGSGKVMVGAVVDSVSEVLNIRENDIKDPPGFGTGTDTNYILGMARTEQGIKVLLDIDQLLTQDQELKLHQVA